jgi:Ca2+-binding RTX toxin-like protein
MRCQLLFSGVATVTLILDAPAALGVNLIYGTDADETIIGCPSSQLHCVAGDPNDEIYGYAGKDIINGYSGDDVIYAGNGDDSVYGQEGKDTIYTAGGASPAVPLTGVGSDFADGGPGDDSIYAQGGTDPVIFYGGDGIDSLTAGPADDRLDGGAGADRLQCLDGDDEAHGGDGDDTLIGAEDDDRLYGEAGNDTTFAGEGDDLLVSSSGADALSGGDGFDTVDYRSSPAGVTANLASSAPGIGGDADGDTFVRLEQVYGSSYQDTIVGEDLVDNVLRGELGDDMLSGLRGDDTLDGGGGADTLDGGTGTDIADYSVMVRLPNGTVLLSGVAVSLATGQGYGGSAGGDVVVGIENLRGTSVNDALTGDGKSNSLWGGMSADTLAGGGDADLFIYEHVSDSMGATPDEILDFGQGQDRIDLSAIDADAGLGGNQAFAFAAGGPGVNATGKVWVVIQGSTVVVNASDNADPMPELQINLQNFSGTLTAGVFVL